MGDGQKINAGLDGTNGALADADFEKTVQIDDGDVKIMVKKV